MVGPLDSGAGFLTGCGYLKVAEQGGVLGTQGLRCLKAPIQERKPLAVFGGFELARGFILCGETRIWPFYHTHPSITVEEGHITFFVGGTGSMLMDALTRPLASLYFPILRLNTRS
jgi:hypothetical protein